MSTPDLVSHPACAPPALGPSVNNNSDDTVGLIVWSAAEIAVTMICIGIPVCRPLYKRWLEKLSTYRSRSGTASSGYQRQQHKDQNGEGSDGPRYGLRTFGGGTMPGASQWRPQTGGEDNSNDAISESRRKSWRRGYSLGGTRLHMVGKVGETSDSDSDPKQGRKHGDEFGEVRLGINGPFNHATAVGGAGWNASEEEILGFELRVGGRGSGCKKRQSDLESGRAHGHGKTSIQVTDEWRVDRSGTMDK